MLEDRRRLERGKRHAFRVREDIFKYNTGLELVGVGLCITHWVSIRSLLTTRPCRSNRSEMTLLDSFLKVLFLRFSFSSSFLSTSWIVAIRYGMRDKHIVVPCVSCVCGVCVFVVVTIVLLYLLFLCLFLFLFLLSGFLCFDLGLDCCNQLIWDNQ